MRRLKKRERVGIPLLLPPGRAVALTLDLYVTDENSPMVLFIIFDFHGLERPCNSEAMDLVGMCYSS